MRVRATLGFCPARTACPPWTESECLARNTAALGRSTADNATHCRSHGRTGRRRRAAGIRCERDPARTTAALGGLRRHRALLRRTGDAVTVALMRCDGGEIADRLESDDSALRAYVTGPNA
ncbi:hypothetical protein MTP03_09190 [Tsukamurella sp. PLM1]|nr:hypothetical protein MTP03_09190 [Tsukamurella sp. PLM1]